ncbi:hypothetical protein D3C73_1164570 [compost metagenome]
MVRRVQAHRLIPDPTQTIANLRITQVVHGDATAGQVGKGHIALPLPIEVGPQMNGAAHVHDDDKGRPFVQRLGVALGLTLGVQHQPLNGVWMPLRRLASSTVEQGQMPLRVQFTARRPLLRLLGLEHKGAAPVAIDEPSMGPAVVK